MIPKIKLLRRKITRSGPTFTPHSIQLNSTQFIAGISP